MSALEEAAEAAAVEGIEVTQVVQDMGHTVDLVAGKATVVRVYLGRPSGGAVNVRGEISVRRTPAGPARHVPSLDSVRLNPAHNGQLRRKREDLRASLNFLLPDSLTSAGRVYVGLASLTNVATGEAVACSNCAGEVRRVTFKESPPLRVRVVKLRYRAGGQANLPSARDVALLNSWLRRAYPVSSVSLTERTVEANFGPPFDEDGDTCDLANAQLTAIRNLDIDNGLDQRTHYYGMVADSGGFMRGCANNIPDSPDPTAVASGPAGPGGYAWDTDGSYGDWYGAHELAHTFGRWHPGFCNENSADDPRYPFERGQLSDSDGAFVGFDIGDQSLGVPMRALPGARWHDVMTYCARQWMSSYTYEGIRRRLMNEDALGPTPQPLGGEEVALTAASALEVNMATGSFISVVGTVNLSKRTGRILYVNPVSNVLSPPAGGRGDVLLRVKAGDGRLIEEYPLRVKVNTCSDRRKDRTGLIDAVIAAHAGARELELVIAGEVVDTYRAGAPPDVANLRRASATEEAVSLAWEGAGSVTYNVQVSTDEGQTWETVAVGRREPDVAIDRSQFPPGSRVTVRVIATDGFTNSVVTTDTFSVEDDAV